MKEHSFFSPVAVRSSSPIPLRTAYKIIVTLSIAKTANSFFNGKSAAVVAHTFSSHVADYCSQVLFC